MMSSLPANMPSHMEAALPVHDANTEGFSSDPAKMAAAVRKLASHAHRVLRAPAPAADEFLDLFKQIAAVESHLSGRPACVLSHWLENLQQQVKARVWKKDSTVCSCAALADRGSVPVVCTCWEIDLLNNEEMVA